MRLSESILFIISLALISCSSVKVIKTEPIVSLPEAIISDTVSGQVMSLSYPKQSKKPEGIKLTFERHHYQFWLKYFGQKEPERFIRHLQNGERYKTLVVSIFKEYGLPADLFYVGLIESGYNSRVRSRARATGPWQFMPKTAKQFGLRIDHQVDERMNIYKSTHAAAKYLKYLYRMFGNWELALSAYNAGEGRVARALKKSGAKDYRGLVKARALPLETIFYVPKIAAARELERYPYKYGLPDVEDHLDLFDRAKPHKLSKDFSLGALSKASGVNVSTIQMLNKDLKRLKIDVRSKKGLVVYLPEGHRIKDRKPTSSTRSRVAVKRPKEGIKKVSKRMLLGSKREL